MQSGEQVSNQGGKPSNSYVHKPMGEQPRRSLCDKDGVSYVFTLDPKNADKLGNAIPIGHATRDKLAWTHESPGMFPSHLNSTSPRKEHHEHNTKFEEKILVHRLKTLNPQKGLYEDAHCNYYTTLETTNREQPFENTFCGLNVLSLCTKIFSSNLVLCSWCSFPGDVEFK